MCTFLSRAHDYMTFFFPSKVNINNCSIFPNSFAYAVGFHNSQWIPLGTWLDSVLVWVTLCYHEISGKQCD